MCDKAMGWEGREIPKDGEREKETREKEDRDRAIQ